MTAASSPVPPKSRVGPKSIRAAASSATAIRSREGDRLPTDERDPGAQAILLSAVTHSAHALGRARDSYADRAWTDVFRAFSAAEREAPLGPEDLERLATAAYMVGKEAEYLTVLEARTPGVRRRRDGVPRVPLRLLGRSESRPPRRDGSGERVADTRAATRRSAQRGLRGSRLSRRPRVGTGTTRRIAGDNRYTNAGTRTSRKIVLAVTCTAMDNCTLRLRHTTKTHGSKPMTRARFCHGDQKW
jgi:hypothetical protein